MKTLLFFLLLTNTALANFTYSEQWIIPETQLCDQYGWVSYTKQAAGILSLGESKIITIPIPHGATEAYSTVKSHASEPSIVFSLNRYSSVCYDPLAATCPVYEIPEASNGLQDSLFPRYGSNPERRHSVNSDNRNIYWYHLNKIDPETGKTQNVGASSMFSAVVTFNLSKAACDERAGVIPQPYSPTCDDFRNAFAPLTMDLDLSFHINRISYNGTIYATDLHVVTNKDGTLYRDGSKIFFSMDLDSSVTYPVLDGILEDYDQDGVSIIQGDENDNNRDIQ